MVCLAYLLGWLEAAVRQQIIVFIVVFPIIDTTNIDANPNAQQALLVHSIWCIRGAKLNAMRVGQRDEALIAAVAAVIAAAAGSAAATSRMLYAVICGCNICWPFGHIRYRRNAAHETTIGLYDSTIGGRQLRPVAS